MSQAADKPNFVPGRSPATIIPLGPPLLTRSSNLPGSFGSLRRSKGQPAWAHRTGTQPQPGSGHDFPPYLVLLRVGFTLPSTLQPKRCALTAPFHPYLPLTPKGVTRRRYLLCGTGRLQALKPESRTLSGTLSYGVRTFLPQNAKHPSGDRLAPCCDDFTPLEDSLVLR